MKVLFIDDEPLIRKGLQAVIPWSDYGFDTMLEAEDGTELMLRVEMLTGVTIYGQATKCREFMDVLRQNNILKMFKQKNTATAPAQPDVLAQIEKLAGLKAAGILSEEEFNQKKAELLQKL